MDKIIPECTCTGIHTLIIILVLAVICKVLLDLYLNTKSGYSASEPLVIMTYW